MHEIADDAPGTVGLANGGHRLGGNRVLFERRVVLEDHVVAGWSAWVSLDLSQLPRLHAYLARVTARPAVQAARAAEGLKG